MKKFLVYCVLIAFGVLLTPRSVWHECENKHDHEHEHHHESSTNFKKKCFACDNAMNAAEEPIGFNPFFFAAFYPKSKEFNVIVRSVDFERTQLLRGPPTV